MKRTGALCWLLAAWLLPTCTHAELTITKLFTFSRTNGFLPLTLQQTADGSFIGATLSGGPTALNGSIYGTIFQMGTNGAVETFFAFDGTNGDISDSVLQGMDGNFYGGTELGGDQQRGNIYRLTPEGQFTSLFSFNGTNGSEVGILTQARDGNLYGTTPWGGIGYTGTVNSGFGTVFKVSTNGEFTTLALFNGTNGSFPQGYPLVEDADGNLYGTTVIGGALFVPSNSATWGEGTVFKVTPQGELTTVFSFSETNGSGPLSLALGTNGDLYGTTQAGGLNHKGTLFRLTTKGALTVLHLFTGGADGGNPWCNLIRGQNGNFFGGAGTGGLGQGTLFELSTAGVLTTLYSFTGIGDGGGPRWLTQGRDGLLYGTSLDGTTIFRLAAPIGPVLPSQQDVNVKSSATLSITNTATDLDIAATTLAYTLIDPPAGAHIDANGIITWTPTLFQSPSVNLITTVVTDDGIPALSATNRFTVTVSSPYDGIDLTSPAQAQADLDGDGTPNLMEFALGNDPHNGSDGTEGIVISTLLENGNAYLSMQFKRRKNSDLPLQYLPEVSSDRQTWTSDPTKIHQTGLTAIDAEFEWVAVRDQIPATPSAPRYIRLRVVED
jgi:uncharacterized repeat protein (TIGR03803 family)